jgi:hypothetical protein
MRPACIIAAAVLWTIAASAMAKVTHLAPSDRAALERPQSIQLLYSTRAIPAAVKLACAAVISDHRFWLADPGKPYNETDAGWDNHIPGRRLLWAARLPEHFVLHYESGGIAHGFHLIVVRLAGADTRVVWRAAADKYKDYSAFLRALKRNKPDDTLDYMF